MSSKTPPTPPGQPLHPVTLLTLREVAARLRIDMSTLWRWRKEGRFPPVIKITPRKQYVRADDLDASEQAQRGA